MIVIMAGNVCAVFSRLVESTQYLVISISGFTNMTSAMNLSQCTSFELAPAPLSIQANVSGWLMKRKNLQSLPEEEAHDWRHGALAAAKKVILGEFNRRFFWMDFNINLVYYAESHSAKRVAFIPFSRLRNVDIITSPVKINQAKSGWVYGICLRTVNRSLDLWAKTEKEQQMWIEALQRAIAESSKNNSSMIGNSPQPASLSRAGSTLSFATSATQVASGANSDEQKLNKDDNIRWGENLGKTAQMLPRIKEVPRTSWDAVSEEGGEAQAPAPASIVKTGTKWDDWDN